MKQLFDDDRRGQVGIGTLIVFIAMVLVAAIAAGVLINTAGFLQNQAEDTGTESTEQVADNLNVITEVGDIGQANGDDIENIRIGVQPAAGADDINLAEITLQYVSDNEFANLVAGVDAGTDSPNDALAGSDQATGDSNPDHIFIDENTDQAQFGINVVTAENNDDVVMTDNADRYEIEIPLSTGGSNENLDEFDSLTNDGDATNNDPSQIADSLASLDEGAEVEITLTTEVGSQTVAFLQVPDSLSGENTGNTVNL
jgi:flagellin FlaB